MSENFEVDVVNRGEDALVKLRQSAYDLLLLDVEMDGMSGLQVTEQLRSGTQTKAYLPIILLTAQTSRESRIEGLKAGATDFLSKPFDPLELSARINNHVYLKRLQDRLFIVNKALEAERAKVGRLQRALLPKEMPQIPGLTFGANFIPSSQASGDYYDVIQLKSGKILLAVGDVSGHGIPSAMHMSVLRATLQKEAGAGEDMIHIITTLNDVLSYALDEFSFVTFYLAEFDPKTLILRQISAGHHPPLLHNLSDNSVEQIPVPSTFPLGIDQELETDIYEYQFKPGQRILIYTDGVTDQTPDNETYFGESRLKSAVRETPHLAIGDACDLLVQRMKEFAGTGNDQDDATMLMMHIES